MPEILFFLRKTALKRNTSNNRVSKYVRQKLSECQGKPDAFTAIIETSSNICSQIKMELN